MLDFELVQPGHLPEASSSSLADPPTTRTGSAPIMASRRLALRVQPSRRGTADGPYQPEVVPAGRGRAWLERGWGSTRGESACRATRRVGPGSLARTCQRAENSLGGPRGQKVARGRRRGAEQALGPAGYSSVKLQSGCLSVLLLARAGRARLRSEAHPALIEVVRSACVQQLDPPCARARWPVGGRRADGTSPRRRRRLPTS